jgi:hypothetical protein
MKKLTINLYIAALLIVGVSCEQEVVQNTAAPCPSDDPTIVCPEIVVECPAGATAGSANFSKFVTIGNSYVAGFQAGALFNASQANSMSKMIADQLKCAGGGTTFNQPDINSVNGYNLQSSIPGVITLGRMVLFDPDGPTGSRSAAPYPAGFPGSSVTCPSAVTTPALPAPYNTADLPAAYTGNKAALNNFGVPLIYLGQSLIPQTGGPPTSNPYYNPFYARFASNPGSSTIIGDALGAAGSFYLIWLGFDDVLLYAATGADGTYPMTSQSDFNTQFNGAINTMLATNTQFKGVVGNIPNFTSLPYFYTVTWDAITLDAATAATLTSSLANNYNAFLDGMVGAGVITAAERDKRRITYVAGKNGVLMTDEELTDLSPYMVGPYAGLAPYARARQAKSTDLVPLAAGSVLGTCNGGNAQAVFGVSYPVSDKYILTPTETTAILTRTAEFNTIITNAVNGSSNRLALADVNSAYSTLLTNKAAISNGVTITPSFAPPTGAFSEDGLHPNTRGYAFTANVFISAINAKFGATVPLVSLAKYSGTGLPVNP